MTQAVSNKAAPDAGRLCPVDRDVWIADGRPVRFYGMPFPTRMTVVRLGGGRLWVHSPVALDDDLARRVAALGPVEHLVAPNWLHYVHLPEWQGAFPDAQSWGAPGVVERAASRGVRLHIDHTLSDTAPPDWAGEIDQKLVRGSPVHKEAVFFHRPSATLILTDLIENFELARLPFWMRPLARLAGVAAPHGGMPRDMAWTFRNGRAELREAVEWMLDRHPQRVILAHGRWFRTDGKAALRRALGWALAQR